jgi:hypothetical protein
MQLRKIMNQDVWTRLFVKVVALNFVLSLIAVTNVAGQEKVKFPVSASSKTLGYSPLWVAHRQGFFDQQGLDVQLVLVSGADKSTMALMGGSVFASSGAIDAIIGATEQGADLVSLGGVIIGTERHGDQCGVHPVCGKRQERLRRRTDVDQVVVFGILQTLGGHHSPEDKGSA